jgi:hypothetical protein
MADPFRVSLLAPTGREQPVLLEVTRHGIEFFQESGKVWTGLLRMEKESATFCAQQRAHLLLLLLLLPCCMLLHVVPTTSAPNTRTTQTTVDPADPVCVDRQVGPQQFALARPRSRRLPRHPRWETQRNAAECSAECSVQRAARAC